MGCAPAIDAAATAVGRSIMWATELQPVYMGILVSLIMGMILSLPISSAAICAGLSLTGLVGQIGVYMGWLSDAASGAKPAIAGLDWIGLALLKTGGSSREV
jgi:uncharacterized membrane protein